MTKGSKKRVSQFELLSTEFPADQSNGNNQVYSISSSQHISDDSPARIEDDLTRGRRIIDDVNMNNKMSKSKFLMEPETNFNPLIEYANEPLLPLYKACVPLESLIYNLSGYVKLALDATPEQPPDGLTIDESAAIRLYTFEWNKPHKSLY
ncbi:unnamed protein product, partial [Adineta ricciae]